MKGLGHTVARSAIAKVLRENGLLPAPDRPTPWRTFLRAHWGRVAAMDFLTTEVWTPKGLETQHRSGVRLGRVRSRERLGGLLRHYSRAAA